MNQTMKVRTNENFADILLAKEMNIVVTEDSKYLIFPNSVVRDEYDRRRRERKRENDRLRGGMLEDHQSAIGSVRIKRDTSYNFSRVPRRPAR
ncbi:hypothetical protein D3C76_222240 [compost metagenome]